MPAYILRVIFDHFSTVNYRTHLKPCYHPVRTQHLPQRMWQEKDFLCR